MRTSESFYQLLPAWADSIVVALMSVAAPVAAGCIHSLRVFQRDFRLYNAEMGGDFFWDGGLPRQSLTFAFLDFACRCLLPALPTFAVLFPFRKRPQLCRTVWIILVALWTWLFFNAEVATR